MCDTTYIKFDVITCDGKLSMWVGSFNVLPLIHQYGRIDDSIVSKTSQHVSSALWNPKPSQRIRYYIEITLCMHYCLDIDDYIPHSSIIVTRSWYFFLNFCEQDPGANKRIGADTVSHICLSHNSKIPDESTLKPDITACQYGIRMLPLNLFMSEMAIRIMVNLSGFRAKLRHDGIMSESSLR